MSNMILSQDPVERKQMPVTTGVLKYFPRAIAAVAQASWTGNQQHHPDKPLFWDKTKSTDHLDCIGRHLIDAGTFDTDDIRHSAKLAWRALANLELELEAAETEEGGYHLPTLQKVQEVIESVRENCTLYSSETHAQMERDIIEPHLDWIDDEIESMKGNV